MGTRKLLLDSAEVLASFDNQGELRGLVDGLRCLADRKPPEGAVKVRIAVAVNNKGEWNSCGFCEAKNDKEIRTIVLDCFDPGDAEIVHFVEAYVPLPVSETVEADVVA